MVSFVVPVYYKSLKSYIVDRANYLINRFTNNSFGFELIIVDASRFSVLKSNNPNVKIIYSPSRTSIFSPALARNEAINFVTKEYIFFFDVDLDFDNGFETSLIEEILHSEKLKNFNFIMLPCLYLSAKGTEQYNRENIEVLKLSFLEGSNELVSRLAIVTSALIMKKDYFIHIGMFCPNFLGHGGEDFELIHRLSAYNPHSRKPEDYYQDIVKQFLADYVGFRQYMAYYAVSYFFSDLVLVHKWHERPLTNLFYFRRVKNESLLLKAMKNFDANNDVWQSNNIAEPIDLFVTCLMERNNYSLFDYPGFFRFKEGITHKTSKGAKLRKLITRPRLFFRDSQIGLFFTRFFRGKAS